MGGAACVDGARTGILPGSFNPPTIAHLELARAARDRFDLDRVVFSLSSTIVDKERLEGLCREDRLLLLALTAEEHPWASVAVVNRGLYSEQAPAFRACLGPASGFWFIVGMDKVLQIFDPRYYEDRDRSLDALFAQARLIAANREEWGEEELQALLAEPRNACYREQVHALTLPARLKGQSSSAVRQGVEAGAACEEALPEVVRRFVAAAGAFTDPYEMRTTALDVLYPVRQWARTEVVLEALLARAGVQGEAGDAVRALLRTPLEPADLRDRLRRLGLTRSRG